MTDEVFPLESSKYKLKGVIGRGATASVFVATCLTNGIEVALKIIDLELCPIDLDKIREEISFWASLNDSHLVKYYTSFMETHFLYIVMEYMDIGSAHEILQFKFKKGISKENIISNILKNTLQALSYFHSHEQIHRDVKTGNILMNRKGKIKLGDFGIAANMIENGERISARFTVVGTPCYMAPEVICAGHGYTDKADIWSLGITAIELALGAAPYSNLFPLEVIVKVTDSPPPTLPKNFSPEFRDFVSTCLQRDPEKRPTAEELLKHNFIITAASEKRVADFFADLPDIPHQYKINHNKFARKRSSSKMTSKNLENENENQHTFDWNFNLSFDEKDMNDIIHQENEEDDKKNQVVENAPSESDIINILKNKILVMKTRINEIKKENRSLNNQIDNLYGQLNNVLVI